MRRSDLVQHKEKEKGANTRTSQIVFGERQHLLRVLDSLEGTDLPIARMQQERRILEELIHARTRDLNQINTAWDEKIGLVLSADAKPEMLEKLAKQAPEEDFYLLRLISEHPRANAKTLNRLAKHPYGAIRENVARHPNADANTLGFWSGTDTTALTLRSIFSGAADPGVRATIAWNTADSGTITQIGGNPGVCAIA